MNFSTKRPLSQKSRKIQRILVVTADDGLRENQGLSAFFRAKLFLHPTSFLGCTEDCQCETLP